MNIFKKKKITCDQSSFYTQLRATTEYTNYLGVVRSGLANAMLGVLWQECKRKALPTGYWAKSNKKAPLPTPLTAFQFKKEKDQTDLIAEAAYMLKNDRMLIEVRKGQVARLLEQAKRGGLAEQLNANITPRREYQTIRPPRALAHGAPPIPGRTDAMNNHAKALAWLTKGVRGNTDVYKNALFTYKKTGFPLGPDAQITTKIWNELVRADANVPKWRISVLGSSYPSSIGGTHLLRRIFQERKDQVWPVQGDAKWEDWAMYFFASVMTVQAFPDANKRISRMIYALVTLSGGIPFKAPKNELGRKLANM